MSFVQAVHAVNDAAGTALTRSITATGGNLFACAGFNVFQDSASTMTDGGNTFTSPDRVVDGGNNVQQDSYYAKNITGGARTVSYNTPNSPSFRRVHVAEYSGQDTAAPLDDHKGAFGSFGGGANAVTTGNGAGTTVNGDTIVSFVTQFVDTVVPTAGTGFSSRDPYSTAAGDASDVEDRVQASSGVPDAGTWTLAAGQSLVVCMMAFKAAAGGHTVTVNQASETDLAQPISRLKTKAIGQNSETDLSQPITKRKQKLLGQGSETDLAQPINRNKLKVLGEVTETDLAQPITRLGAKVVAVGQVVETDLAQPISRLKTKLLGQTTETDLAQPIAKSKLKLLGQNSEIDLAQPIHWKVQRLVNQVQETDAARPIAAIKTGGPVTASPYFYDLTGVI